MRCLFSPPVSAVSHTSSTGPTAPDSGQGGEGEVANHVSMYFTPPSFVETTYLLPGNMVVDTSVQDEAVTRVGHVVVDTRNVQMIITVGTNSFRREDGVAEKTASELAGLDQSRRPGDLQDWSAPR